MGGCSAPLGRTGRAGGRGRKWGADPESQKRRSLSRDGGVSILGLWGGGEGRESRTCPLGQTPWQAKCRSSCLHLGFQQMWVFGHPESDVSSGAQELLPLSPHPQGCPPIPPQRALSPPCHSQGHLQPSTHPLGASSPPQLLDWSLPCPALACQQLDTWPVAREVVSCSKAIRPDIILFARLPFLKINQ